MNRIVRFALSTVVVGVAMLAPGCAGRAPATDSIPYEGPPITIDSGGGAHQVVMHAPTSGWSFTLDRIDEARDGRDAYVTIRRPNPSMIYTQAIVEQRIGTGVPSTMELRVHARVQEFTAAPDSGTYRPAASSAR